MPATTPNGYPYAEPTDPLVQWPATSQQLAQKIDSDTAGMVRSRTANVELLSPFRLTTDGVVTVQLESDAANGGGLVVRSGGGFGVLSAAPPVADWNVATKGWANGAYYPLGAGQAAADKANAAAINPKTVQSAWLNGFSDMAVLSNAGQGIGLTWNAPNIRCTVDASEVGTFAWASGSSRTIKRDIGPLGLSDLFDRIVPVEFRYRDDAPVPPDEDRDALRRGFIAEDVAAAGVATKVDTEGNPTGLCDADLIAILWAKVQELSAKVAELEAR